MFKLSLASCVLFFCSLSFANPPPYPPPPGYGPPPPGYSDYGPGYTSQWLDAGFFKAKKFIQEEVTINVGHYFVNEVAFRGDNAPVDISGAWLYLSSGQIIELRQAYGTVHPNRDVRFFTDGRYSLRTAKIVLRVSSPQVIGPSGKVQVFLGIAR